MDMTESEEQLLQMLREADADSKITIEFRDGACEVEMTCTMESRKDRRKYPARLRGTGPTFDRAWDDMGRVD